MQRGENPEDLYYLCHIDDSWYIVYETDYIESLSYACQEANEIFAPNIQPLHWLVKKDHFNAVNKKTVTIETSDYSSIQDSLILKKKDSHLKQVILAVRLKGEVTKSYNPNNYGYTL